MKLKANKGDPFDALGNSYRREIVELLAHKPRSVQEIADRLPISRPAVSRHLRVLNKAGHVSDEQLGTRRALRGRQPRPERAVPYLRRAWGQPAGSLQHLRRDTQPITGSTGTSAE